MKARMPPQVLVSSNYAWTIVNFRLPLIRKLKSEGYEVHVLTQFDGYEEKLREEVDSITHLFVSRKGINPFVDFLTILDYVKHFFVLKPDILLLFTIKPVIYGSIAARIFRIPKIVMITGLGTAFLKDNWLKSLVQGLYRIALRKPCKVFFQNLDDKGLFISRKIVCDVSTELVPGSGIDLESFSEAPYPDNQEPKFLLIARMLRDKGVGEYVEAARILKKKYPKMRFQLLGPLGVENRSAILKNDMDNWVEEEVIEYLGETDNVRTFIEQSDCIVLPSYREGTSRVLLEAAAMARPIIASNVTGCREVVDDQQTGFLCEAKNSSDLAEKIELMSRLSKSARRQMGLRGRKKVAAEFDQKIVAGIYLEALREVTAEA